jgi:metal-dependent amidase/aminoacylase/carboxypeptidase family protein
MTTISRRALTFALALAACAAPQTPPPNATDTQRADLIAFRRDLHRHPELAGQEARTAQRVAERLEALGFEVRRGIGGHGVVALLRGMRPGPIVAFRADMDAVRDTSPDPVDFASTVPGVRHICGHDIHTTIGVAIGESFAALGGDFPGTLMLVFQPAEENVQGARAMLADGAFAAPKPDAIFAFHTAPYEVGQIGYSEATLMASRDRVVVTVHGSRAAADDMRQAMLELSDSERFANHPVGADFVFAEVGAPQSGGQDLWRMDATYSLGSSTARERVRSALQAEALRMRTNGRATVDIDYRARFAPGVDNDLALTRRALTSMRAELGDTALRPIGGVTPAFSEDFGAMLDEAPGAMFFLGVSNEARGWVGMPHSPGYVADEDAIFIGARAMTRVLRDYLEAG